MVTSIAVRKKESAETHHQEPFQCNLIMESRARGLAQLLHLLFMLAIMRAEASLFPKTLPTSTALKYMNEK
jgi:hypothetical protein